MLSHELRNPIGAIMNALECAEISKYDNDQPALEYQVIARQSRHMARLLDDLLDVARFGQDRIEFRRSVTDMVKLAAEAVEASEYHFTKKRQVLEAVFDEHEKILADVDPARIKQAQVNLLTNASKYTAEGKTIRYEMYRDGDEVVIAVQDSGEGIAAEMLDSVFELFVQSENTLGCSSGGMGVGLSLAKNIVQAHEGTISVSSEGIGKGSRFEMRLPLTEESMGSKITPAVQTPTACRVLLVEDNDDARLMLTKMLQLHGYEVAEAANGAEALEMVGDFHPTVAVIDIGLPEMSGYEVAEAIKGDATGKSSTLGRVDWLWHVRRSR